MIKNKLVEEVKKMISAKGKLMCGSCSARFSFLLGVPLFLGAGAKQIFDVGIGEINMATIAGVVTAFIVAILVIHYLLKFLRNNTLYIFIWYRLILAFIIVLAIVSSPNEIEQPIYGDHKIHIEDAELT